MWLPFLLFVVREVRQASTQYYPFEILLFRRHPGVWMLLGRMGEATFGRKKSLIELRDGGLLRK